MMSLISAARISIGETNLLARVGMGHLAAEALEARGHAAVVHLALGLDDDAAEKGGVDLGASENGLLQVAAERCRDAVELVGAEGSGAADDHAHASEGFVLQLLEAPCDAGDLIEAMAVGEQHQEC